ncbi:MAG: hypothetical protein ABIF87_01305 [Pseudomonadota bacterium]
MKKILAVSLLTSLVFFIVFTPRAQGKEFDFDQPFREPMFISHITETGTMYGPVKKDVYILYPAAPKDGALLTADGGGGWFINKADLFGGPYSKPREVCAAIQGLPREKLDSNSFYFNCAGLKPKAEKPSDVGPDTGKPDEEPAPAVEPAEEPPSKADEEKKPKASDCDEDRRDEEISEVHKIQDAVAYADEQYQSQKLKLGMMRIAAGKKRAKIKFLESAIKVGDYSDEMKQKLEKRVEQLQDELYEILKEQDNELKNALYNYDDALSSLRKVRQDSKCDDVKKVLDSLEKKYVKKRALAELELLLASSDPGQREKFHALTRKYIGEDKYKDVVYLMRALDYVESKDPRSALYALRKAFKENPDNKAVRAMLDKIELGYLRAIDDKITGEAAAIRAKLWGHLSEHGEEGFLGALKDILTTGVTASAGAIGGKPQSLADLAATLGDEAQVQHSGLILIIRLREAGIPLSEIKGFKNEQFIAKTKELFKWNLTKEQALKMRFTINMAFKNTDVNRLSAENKQQFDIDRGKSYFNSDAFDATWQDWIGDVVNIKNVAIMLGPSAVISSGGKLAIHGSKLAKDTLTVRDAFSNLIRLPELADKFAKTKVGQACISELFKFEQSTGFVSKVLAEALIQQGIIKAGETLGGRAGALAAEVITVLGVGDIDQTLRILKQNGVTPKTLASLAKNLRKAAEGAEQIGTASKKYFNQIDDALEESAKKGVISPSSKKAMKQSQDEIDQQFLLLMRKAQDGDLTVAQRQYLEQMRMMKEAFEDAMSGNRAGAKVAKKTVENLEEQSRSGIGRLTKQADEIDGLAKSLKNADQNLTIKSGQKPKDFQDVVRDPGLEAPGVPKSAKTPKEIIEEANTYRKMKLKYNDETSITSAADNTLRRQEYDEAINGYNRLLARTDLDDTIRKQIRTKSDLAKQTKDGAARLKPGGGSESPAVKRVMRDFEPDELQKISRTPESRLVPLKTTAGETSLSKPYKVLYENGEAIGVFKPTVPSQRPGNIDVKGEVVASRLAKEVGINTPASAPITIEIGGKKQTGVIVRYIKDGGDLTGCDAGIQRAMKKQVAEDRAMSVFLGDPDRHSRNFYVTKSGEVFNIDHGNADIFEPSHVIDWSKNPPDADIEDMIVRTMDVRSRMPAAGDAIIDGIDKQITYKDMADTVKKIQAMDETKIRGLLQGVMEQGDEMERAVQCLMFRKKHLKNVLQKNFPPIQVKLSINNLRQTLRNVWASLGVRLQLRPDRIFVPALQGGAA